MIKKKAFRDSGEAVILIGIDNTITKCSQRAKKIFGVRKKEIIGTTFKDFIHSKASALNLTTLFNHLENGAFQQPVYIQIKEKDKRLSLYSVTIKAGLIPGTIKLVFKKKEKIKVKEYEATKVDLLYLTNISSELSEISNEQEVLEFVGSKLHELFPRSIILMNSSDEERTHLRFEKVFGIPDPILSELTDAIGYNPFGKSFKISEQTLALCSKPRLNLIEGSVTEFLNSEVLKPVAHLMESVLKVKSVYSIGIADQGQFFGIVYFLNTSKREPVNSSLLESIIYLCYLSISRIRSLNVIEENERKYRLLADNVKDVIFTLDLNLNYTYISPSIKTLRGFEPSELIGQPVFKSLSAQSSEYTSLLLKVELERVRRGETKSSEVRLIETELLHKNGTSVWVEIKASFIFDENNQPVGILGVTRDIRDRKLAENKLLSKNAELNEANAQKDKFFSIIAHDLKSPFGHILNFSSLLSDHYDQYSDEKRKQFISLISKSSQQIYLLLENLLDWARSQGRKIDYFPQNISLQKLVTDVSELLSNSAYSKNIEIVNRIPPDTRLVADEYMLKTILRNLIGNAIKFTHDGGEVKVETTKDTKAQSISITDTGVGMEQSLINSIFSLDLNITKAGTKGEKGTGLGLLLCKEFVEIHGGKINIESVPGKGSTITFTIPFTDSSPAK
ncbi:MAG TPA: PAS domain S-box protein [Bacteroidales bacterium]|nr:PAS domain S-box protein [Bacteroidales bacterium]